MRADSLFDLTAAPATSEPDEGFVAPPQVYGFDPTQHLVDVRDYLSLRPSPPPLPDASLFTPESLAEREGMGWLADCRITLLSPVSPDLPAQLHQLALFAGQLRDEARIAPKELFPTTPSYVPAPVLALDTETTGLDTRTRYDYDGKLQVRTRLITLTVAVSDRQAYMLPVGHTEEDGIPNWRLDAVCDFVGHLHENFLCVYHKADYDLEVLALNGVTKFRNYPYLLDTMIMDFLDDPNSQTHGLKGLAKKHLKRNMVEIQELMEGLGARKRKAIEIRFEQLTAHQALVYATSDVLSTYGLFEYYQSRPNATSIFTNQPHPMQIDHRLLHTLRQTKRPGLPINYAYFYYACLDAMLRVHLLEHEIYRFVGHDFNIASTPQLNEVLFEQFGVPLLPGHVQNKTKAGEKPLFSTDEKHLTKLYELYPDKKILQYIVVYRGLVRNISNLYLKCLSNSYNDALLPYMRVFLDFTQTRVETGRLASSSSGGRERVSLAEKAKGAVTARYDRGDWSCGFNSQGIPADDFKTAKARRVVKLPAAAGVNLEDPYGAEIRKSLVRGVACL